MVKPQRFISFYRLIQNRESAKRCRLKKKEEKQKLSQEREMLVSQNKELKEKLEEVTQLLYSKIEENQQLYQKIESNQT